MEIEISTDTEKLDIEAIHDFISNRSYWGQGRTIEQVHKTLSHSICFGAYVDGAFSGFTRVVIDTVVFAYVLDLFVLENYRGLGVSRRLVEAMLSHKDLQSTNWLLGTRDAHGLYAKYGFQAVSDPNRYMRKANAVPVNKYGHTLIVAKGHPIVTTLSEIPGSQQHPSGRSPYSRRLCWALCFQEIPMRYKGSCHCHAVTFEVEAPEIIEANYCNCSICTKSGFLHLIVPLSKFRILTGEEYLSTYTFNTGVAKHTFCKMCGIKPFYTPRSNPDGVDVNVHCLDTRPGKIYVANFDGRNWEKNAHELAHKSKETSGKMGRRD